MLVSKYNFFWDTMEKVDWSTEGDGDNEKILKPVVDYLASLDDDKIFQFEELMTQLLYDLDSRTLFEHYIRIHYSNTDGPISDAMRTDFLYTRCAALINGEQFYQDMKSGEYYYKNLRYEFEPILYVSQNAWGQKHNEDSADYPNITTISCETGSNHALWHVEHEKDCEGEQEKGENKGKVFDKVTWHTDYGASESETIECFRQIFIFLKGKEMLNEEGLGLLADGIDESLSLSEHLVNEKGFKFLSKYYSDLAEFRLQSLKKVLEYDF